MVVEAGLKPLFLRSREALPKGEAFRKVFVFHLSNHKIIFISTSYQLWTAMSNDDSQAANSSPNISRNAQLPVRRPAQEGRSLFSIPPPVKRVFDKFPLRTYTENELPLRAPAGREENVLHIFATEEDAERGRPSFNPACLKWQVSLSFILCDILQSVLTAGRSI